MNISIEPFTKEHLDSVLAIEHQCFPTPWSRESFAYELENNPMAHYLIIYHYGLGQALGYAGYWLILEEAHVTNVAVDPKWQRQGLGRLLMESLIYHALRHGAERMTLEVRVSNQAARSLYELLGFITCGRRKGYYEDTKEDAIIMWKSLRKDSENETS